MVMSASTFSITTCLPLAMASSAKCVPILGLPVASMTTSMRPARARASRLDVMATRPRSIAASISAALSACTVASSGKPARVVAARAWGGRISATAPRRRPGIRFSCTTMSVPIWPQPANPMVTGRPRLGTGFQFGNERRDSGDHHLAFLTFLLVLLRHIDRAPVRRPHAPRPCRVRPTAYHRF